MPGFGNLRIVPHQLKFLDGRPTGGCPETGLWEALNSTSKALTKSVTLPIRALIS